jgi:hypothetical protein
MSFPLPANIGSESSDPQIISLPAVPKQSSPAPGQLHAPPTLSAGHVVSGLAGHTEVQSAGVGAIDCACARDIPTARARKAETANTLKIIFNLHILTPLKILIFLWNHFGN